MKNYICVLLPSAVAVIMLISCSTGEKDISLKDYSFAKSGEESAQNPEYNYDRVLRAQNILLKDFSWPRSHELDLNDDGTAEKFLAVEGYSRGMDYALFTKKNSSWVLISGDSPVPSGHLGIEKLKRIKERWHDFVAFQPSGRGGVIESYYSWTGNRYILKEQKEVKN